MAVLFQVRVKRTVPKNKIESVSEDLEIMGSGFLSISGMGETAVF
jgi:hypothetical protein